jgi:hypothetical protein
MVRVRCLLLELLFFHAQVLIVLLEFFYSGVCLIAFSGGLFDLLTQFFDLLDCGLELASAENQLPMSFLQLLV